MRTRSSCAPPIVLLYLLLGAAAAWSQTSVRRFACDQPAAGTVITTDRPSFTNSSTVVPCLSLQVENGLLESAIAGQRAWDLPETSLRLGLTNSTELRITVPDYLQNTNPGIGFKTGLGDLALGAKQQLGPLHHFDLSLIAYVTLPTGAHATSSGGYDPALQLPWSRKLSPNWTTLGMLSILWPTQTQARTTRRNVTGQTTLLVDRQLTKPWDAFIEYAGSFPERGAPQHTLHLGTSYKLSPRQQVDVRGGVGFAGYPADHIFGFGYSIRFDLQGTRPAL